MIEQPKILSVITIPSGGWQLRFKISSVTQFDTTLTATMAAGDYFMAWDCQSDDFLRELTDKMIAVISPVVRGGDTFGVDGDDLLAMRINSSHKVVIQFDGLFQTDPHRDVKIEWTALDGPSIAKVLGFDHTADDQATGSDWPALTGDYHHAYGWYADEDGCLRNKPLVDVHEADVQQMRGLAGVVKTQLFADRFDSELELYLIRRIKTYSNQVGYTETPVRGFERNEGLECWWREARQGKRFRVYRDGQVDTSKASDTATLAGESATTLTVSGKSFDVEPQEWAGCLVHMPNISAFVTFPMRWLISSHTATVLTIPEYAGYEPNNGTGPLYLFDQPYGTYVLDLETMPRFQPLEAEGLDRFSIKLPLFKYVAP